MGAGLPILSQYDPRKQQGQGGNTLEVPSIYKPPAGTDSIDHLLDAMARVESGGQRNPYAARGKAGEIGQFQILPTTAQMYGVNPQQLADPKVNREVAKRYMTDLMKRYNGNMLMAVAAYNAGAGNVDKGNIPSSTKQYINKILGYLGPASAGAAEGPEEEYKGPVLNTPPPRGASGETPYTGTVSSTPPKEPGLVRAAGWLPTAGNMAGQFIGGTAGAAIPIAGETGVPEALGATAGGAMGAGLGAEGENAVRRAYGLPPVSVGTEAAWGAAGSGAGALLPFVARFRKAAQIARSTGMSFEDAIKAARETETGLASRLGTHWGNAQRLAQGPAQPVRQAYVATREAGLGKLGQMYDQTLKPYANQPIANTAAALVNGQPGQMLELAGKPIRAAVEQKLQGPMTVKSASDALSTIRQIKRGIPADNRVAGGALSDIENALKGDIRKVVGPQASKQLDQLDGLYARQIARFPSRGVVGRGGAFTAGSASDAILKTKAGEEGRAVQVINQMRARGQLKPLQDATSARIFQRAATSGATNMADRMTALRESVSSVDRGAFDAMYGKNAQATWLKTADALSKRQKELLKHPDQAAAIAGEVRRYLRDPTLFGQWTHYLGHRAMFGLLMMGGGYEFGSGEVAAAGAALLGIQGYEIAAHSPRAMAMLEKAATSKDARTTARLLVSAISTGISEMGKSASGDTAEQGEANAPE